MNTQNNDLIDCKQSEIDTPDSEFTQRRTNCTHTQDEPSAYITAVVTAILAIAIVVTVINQQASIGFVLLLITLLTTVLLATTQMNGQ